MDVEQLGSLNFANLVTCGHSLTFFAFFYCYFPFIFKYVLSVYEYVAVCVLVLLMLAEKFFAETHHSSHSHVIC